MKASVTCRAVVGLMVVVFLSGAASGGVYVSDIQLAPTPSVVVFDAPDLSFATPAWSGVSGILKVSRDADWRYDLLDVSVSLTPSLLKDELSYAGLFQPWVAKGRFYGGAGIEIAGTIVDTYGVKDDFTGTLIEGYVSAEFLAYEDELIPDYVIADQEFVLTGGELLDGENTGLRIMDSSFSSKYSSLFCSQQGQAGVTNFLSDIYSGPSGTLQLWSDVPEPVTCALLGIGAVACFSRPRRARSGL